MDIYQTIKIVSKKLNLPQEEIHSVVDSLLSNVIKTLKRGEIVYLDGFGTFRPEIINSVKKIDSATGKEKEIPTAININFIKDFIIRTEEIVTSKELNIPEEKEESITVDEEEINYSEEEPGIRIAKSPEINADLGHAKKFETLISDIDFSKEIPDEEIIKKANIELKEIKEVINTEEKADFSTVEKPIDEISANVENVFENTDLSVSSEIFESLVHEKMSEKSVPDTDFNTSSEIQINREEANMAEIPKKGDEKKFILGEEIKSSSSNNVKDNDQRPPIVTNVNAPRRDKSSPILWIILVVLVLILIIAGSYYLLTKRSLVKTTTEQVDVPLSAKKSKETPPVIIQDEPIQETKSDTVKVQTSKTEKKGIISQKDVKEQKPEKKEDVKKTSKNKVIIVDEEVIKSPETKKSETTKKAEIKETPETAPVVIKKQEVKITRKKSTPVKKKEKESVTPSNYSQYGHVSIVVSSYSNVSNAKSEVARLKRSGFRAYYEGIEINGKQFYRVKVGNYPSEDAAQKDFEKIRNKFKSDAWIQN